MNVPICNPDLNPTHPNFSKKEFRCKCGCGLGFEDMKRSTLEKLYEARDIAGVPFNITSAIRCKEHNKAVGGSDNSAHLRGYALDIATVTSRERFTIVAALLEVGFPRLGINFARNFIHIDDDVSLPTDVLFSY